MDRRDFLKKGAIGAAIGGALGGVLPFLPRAKAGEVVTPEGDPGTLVKRYEVGDILGPPKGLEREWCYPSEPVIFHLDTGWNIFAEKGGILCGYKCDMYGQPVTPMYCLSGDIRKSSLQHGGSTAPVLLLYAAIKEHWGRMGLKVKGDHAVQEQEAEEVCAQGGGQGREVGQGV